METDMALKLSTDLLDYAPDSTAWFTISGFDPGDTISFQINLVDPGADGIFGTADDSLAPGPAGVLSWTVIDGADGAADGLIVTGWYVDPAYLNTTIQLTAFDATTGDTISVVFTDSSPADPILDANLPTDAGTATPINLTAPLTTIATAVAVFTTTI